MEHTQLRGQGGEGVWSNLGVGGGQPGQQGGFTSIGQADETDISQKLEFDFQPEFFTGSAWSRLARSTVCRGGKTGIAEAPSAAVRCGESLTGLGEVGEDPACLCVFDNGTGRDINSGVLAASAVFITALAVPAPVRLEMGTIAKIDQ